MRANRCYHADLGIPSDAPEPIVGHCLTYSVHAHGAAVQDRVQHQLPCALPTFDLVEVELLGQVGNEPVKWVVRCRLDSERELVLVITSEYMVKTVWVNRADDTHATLDRTKYDRVPAFA